MKMPKQLNFITIGKFCTNGLTIFSMEANYSAIFGQKHLVTQRILIFRR